MMYRRDRIRRYGRRHAFTLVEMLVAVALISILMLMFAQIFSLASDILGRQRGLASNDQSERMLRTVLRTDLNRRTFRKIIPFVNGSTPGVGAGEGYFHIDEGDKDNGADDILQFTLDSQLKEYGNSDRDADPFYGAALTFNPNFTTDPHQPDFDDDLMTPNQVGASRFGEVVYFLRNGNLYRRVLLLRDKDNGSGSYVPQDSASVQLIPGTYTGNFWTDFDYCAAFDMYDIDALLPPPPPGFVFLGKDHRDNTQAISVPSLGIPRFRFGFCPSFNDADEGKPRKTVTDGTFIGRFTRGETSDSSFSYPVTNTLATNPLYPGTPLTYDATTGVVSELSAGTRYSEDILLSNVHSFDIKVWDPGFILGADNAPGVVTNGTAGGIGDDDGDKTDDNFDELGALGSDDWNGPDGIAGNGDDADPRRFLDLGHGLAGVGNPAYAFSASANAQLGNCYDTWHPHASVGNDTTVPFNPTLYLVGPDGAPGNIGDDDGINGPEDNGEFGWTGSDDIPQQVPLKMIRIHIRYVDQKSDQMRDVIIVHSLTD